MLSYTIYAFAMQVRLAIRLASAIQEGDADVRGCKSNLTRMNGRRTVRSLLSARARSLRSIPVSAPVGIGISGRLGGIANMLRRAQASCSARQRRLAKWGVHGDHLSDAGGTTAENGTEMDAFDGSQGWHSASQAATPIPSPPSSPVMEEGSAGSPRSMSLVDELVAPETSPSLALASIDGAVGDKVTSFKEVDGKAHEPNERGAATQLLARTSVVSSHMSSSSKSKDPAELAIRLQQRIQYLTGRYAKHAPYWQLVIWARQLALMLDATVARAVIENGGVADQRAVVWVQAVVALAVLGSTWWYHARVQPYEFAFQNLVEHFLFASNTILILLGTVYTIYSLFLQAGSTVQKLFEGLMLVVLLASIALTAGYLTWSYKIGLIRQTQRERDDLYRAWLASNAGPIQRLRGMSMGRRPSSLTAPGLTAVEATTAGQAAAHGRAPIVAFSANYNLSTGKRWWAPAARRARVESSGLRAQAVNFTSL